MQNNPFILSAIEDVISTECIYLTPWSCEVGRCNNPGVVNEILENEAKSCLTVALLSFIVYFYTI